jgi:hypothetical protein
MTDITPREIRAMLQQRVTELVGKLFPHYSISYPVFTPLNPTRPDKHPGSFVIWTAGAAAGGYNEYSPAGSGKASGDVIDLIAYVHNRAGDRKFALAWARDFLGLKTMAPAEKRAAVRQARDHAVQITAAQSDAIKRRVAKANAMWGKTVPIACSVAETYLASRRIPLMLVKNRENDLRFLPDLEFWKLGEWDRSVTPWKCLKEPPRFPAMVAAMRNAAGDLTAVHCTFLRRDGMAKADVGGEQAKLMRGEARGSVIRLTRGADNLTLDDARAHGIVQPYGISEGIENGLSVALAVPEARIVAAGSFDLMLAAGIPDIADPIIYIRDNDNNVKADEKVQDRIDELAALGKQATQMAPHDGKDFNDLM